MATQHPEKTPIVHSKRRSRPMSNDLMAGLIGIVIIAAGLSMGVNYFIANQKAERALDEAADQYLSYLTQSLEFPIWFMDDKTIQQICDAYMSSGLFSLLEIVSNEDEPKNIYFRKKADDDDMVLREGTVGHGEEIIGTIRIGLSKTPYKRELGRLLRSSIWIALAIVLAMMTAVFFLARRLAAPIVALTRTAVRISEGQLDLEAEIQGSSEVDRLSAAFNKMTRQLGHLLDKEAERTLTLEREIAERKQAEAALKESQERLINLTANVPGVVIQFSTTRDYAYTNEIFNAKMTEIFGLEKDSEAVLDDFYACIPEEEKDAYAASLREAIDTVSPWNYEGRFNKPNGGTIWFSGQALPKAEGDTIVFYGVLMDISERKQIEDALREKDHLLQDIGRLVKIGAWKFDVETGRSTTTEEVARIYDFESRQDVSVEKGLTCYHGEDRKKIEHAFNKLAEHGVPYDLRLEIVSAKGIHKWVRTFGYPMMKNGRVVQVQGSIQDITELKLAEKALLENERLLNNILESMHDGIIVMDREFKYQIFNKGMEKIVGLSRSYVIDKRPWEVFSYISDSNIEKAIRSALNGVVTESLETQLPVNDGEVRWYRDSFYPLKDENGSIIGVVGVINDITQRKQDEEELRRLRSYLSNIINSMPSVLVGVNSEGLVTQWNYRAEQVTGIRSEQARSQPLAKIFPRLSDEMDRIQASIRERRVLRDSKVFCEEREEPRYENVTIYPLVANGVEGAVIRVDDVTEQVHMEELMIQSEKMLSVGGLAAGMAHEINNPLAGMLQTIQVMAQRLQARANLPANRKAAEDAGITMEAIERFMENRGIPRMIEAIMVSGERVSGIVTNMLSFARKDDTIVSSQNLNTILDKTIELAETDYDMKKEYDFKQVRITREYDDGLPDVPCRASKIQQVVLNILTNGAQAMQGAGTLNAGFFIRTYVDADRNMACIEIEDNGPGMDEKVRKHVFDPFFTTKPVGVGTGLGLSVSYFIITENHKGEMAVESSPGAGAKFIIRLPLFMEKDQV